ncbi:hypothetical protein [Puniceibacterium sediminis]|nr:hypothetical protein [Puniceibacterium sediminis]
MSQKTKAGRWIGLFAVWGGGMNPALRVAAGLCIPGMMCFVNFH